MKNLNKVPKKRKPKSNPIPGADLIEGVEKLLNAAIEYGKIKEEEQTKREAIRRQSQIKIEEIRANKEIFINYISMAYAERRYVYEELFEKLDKGIEKDNMKLVEMAMMGIVTQIKENPFESFLEFKKNLADPAYIEEF